MLINLTKGQRIDIGLQRVGIGLGWNPNEQASGDEFDLDASAFLLAENGKIPDNGFIVYYNNPLSMDSSVSSTGDNRTGEGDGDDETLMADLNKVDSRISEIVIVVTIHEAAERKQNFGQVRESFIRIYNAATNEEICKYELDEDFSTESVVEFGRLYRRNGQWKFEAIGRGHQGGLQAMVDRFS